MDPLAAEVGAPEAHVHTDVVAVRPHGERVHAKVVDDAAGGGRGDRSMLDHPMIVQEQPAEVRGLRALPRPQRASTPRLARRRSARGRVPAAASLHS